MTQVSVSYTQMLLQIQFFNPTAQSSGKSAIWPHRPEKSDYYIIKLLLFIEDRNTLNKIVTNQSDYF